MLLSEVSNDVSSGVPSEVSQNVWQALAKPMKKFKTNLEFKLSKNITARVLGRTEDGTRLLLKLSSEMEILSAIKQDGSIPIPPYIRKGRSDLKDRKQYQTNYAQVEGSVAAPTAGLHFSKEVLSEIEKRKIEVDYVTLHVSQWSFSQVADNFNVSKESYSILESTWNKILKARNSGGRVIAVGTTTVRALESFFLLEQKKFDTLVQSDLFVKPGFNFNVVDSLITNFHQPNSTHLAMVSAFFKQSNIEQIYKHALISSYRFLSYGDSCFLDKNCA